MDSSKTSFVASLQAGAALSQTTRITDRAGGLPKFFRAVSVGEFADWRATGRLGPGPSGMEGKHLWGRVEHAEAFGRLVQRRLDPAEFYVLEVRFQPEANVPCYNEQQDGIGAAYFADEGALELVADIREVMAVPKYASENE